MKTIVALATSPANCAIHIIRVSGDKTYKIVQTICSKKIVKKGYTIQQNTIIDKDKIIDNVLIMKFIAPKSYTGEDLIEINCHGGNFIAKKIIELLIKNGCQYAKNGEFSQRALLNNKINLLNAAGINNAINATNLNSLIASQNSINGNLTLKLKKILTKIFYLIGTVEVNIDYPEYDGIENINNNTLITKLILLKNELQDLYKSSQLFLKIANGFNIVLVGQPNVGKSSLLNKLLHENKAIVSNIPGTTRDIIEGKIIYKNVTMNFIDTAGIRNKTNSIEKIGIKKAYQKIKTADLIIFISEITRNFTQQERQILKKIKNKKYIILLNKTDLKKEVNKEKGIKFSCKTSNIFNLLDNIFAILKCSEFSNSDLICLQTDQQINVLQKTIKNIDTTIIHAKKKYPIDLLAEDLHSCYNELDQLIGNKDIKFIDKFFASFCVGK